MAKAFGMPLEVENAIAKAFENYEISDIDKMMNGEIPVLDSAKMAISYVKQYPELFDYVRKLDGLPKSFGLHACGKVVSTRPLNEFLPSCYDSNGIRYLQGDMHDVEDVGLVKVDILGLRTIDQEYDTLEQVGEDISFLDPRQDYSDDKVLDIFRSGDTVGVFQMSSGGMKQTLKKMNVSGIEDLSIANALYRPGAMAYIDNFCRRRQGEETFEYLHPDLEPILCNTYGILVFQEQLIAIGRMAGIKNPDLLRKATGKKDIVLMNQVQPELREKLLQRGWSEEQFNQLWDNMVEFSHYSFNKAHSSAYAIISYMTAKEKAYYPAQFFAGLCNSYIGKSDFVKEKAEEIIADMYAHQISIAPFDFRHDHRRCNVVDNKILYGIPLILELNEVVAEAVFNLGQDPPQYFWQALKYLYDNHVDKSQVQILILLGFFNMYGSVRQLLKIKEVFSFFKCGEAKKISKTKVDESSDIFWIVATHATDKSEKTGEVLKNFTILDMTAILEECEQWILSVPVSDLDIKTQLANQRKYLGFAPIANGNEDDRKRLVVGKIFPATRKKDGKQFGWNITASSLGSGKQSRYTVFNKIFDTTPIREGDVIEVVKYSSTTSNGVRYYNLDEYKRIC